ncbi:MAG: cytochrome C oxidase subunit IV family protein [Candidatus Hydrogenedentes bacterium]|nr:cytochrome C oxidase subunit IV family protein [Candidatus Hydrogenedentota bacterium]
MATQPLKQINQTSSEESDQVDAHHHAEAVRKHVWVYVAVFLALLVLTALTVTARSMNFGLALAVSVALLIATVKGSLVAGYFMHLVGEKRLVYIVLAITAIFLLALLVLPVLNLHDGLVGTGTGPWSP